MPDVIDTWAGKTEEHIFFPAEVCLYSGMQILGRMVRVVVVVAAVAVAAVAVAAAAAVVVVVKGEDSTFRSKTRQAENDFGFFNSLRGVIQYCPLQNVPQSASP